eukprot:6185827-Pleurochrysis_carterae.AAC.4
MRSGGLLSDDIYPKERCEKVHVVRTVQLRWKQKNYFMRIEFAQASLATQVDTCNIPTASIASSHTS